MNPVDEFDPRPRPPDWSQIIDMVDGAKARGFSQDQIDYLRAVVGICWAKAFKAGELAAQGEQVTSKQETRTGT